MRALWRASKSSPVFSEQAETASGTSHSPEQRYSTTTPGNFVPPVQHSDVPNFELSPSILHNSCRSKYQKSVPKLRRSPTLVGIDEPIDIALASGSYAHHTLGSMNNPNNMFPSFLDTTSNSSAPNNSMQRPLPMASQQQQHQVNGTGGGMNGLGGGMSNGSGGLPMNAGQQMDVNMLYQKVVELSDVLRENRERTQGIVAGAEELATRAAANGASPSLQEANAEISGARIAELERQLAREQNKTRTMLREQKENTKLIGEYETAVGNIVEMVRNYSFNNKAEKTSLQLHYNKLLQDEKDAHLEARLEKDHWHSKFMRSVEMLREAYRLRCEEEELPTMIVAGLQNEVRAYRSALGMEKELPEDEFGWEILKDVVDRGDDS